MLRPIECYYNNYYTLNFSSIFSLNLFDKNVVYYILNDIENRCGYEYIYTTYLTKPKLRREITDYNYNYKQKYVSPLQSFYTSWFKTRLDRANERQQIIKTPIFHKLGYGYLLHDLINKTYKEQNYFRISNAYKRYKKNNLNLIKKCLNKNISDYLINNIISYIHIDLSYKLFADIIQSNINNVI